MKTIPTTFSFECTACGKCCNSGPHLSLPELFHHERRFIGTLSLRRVMHLRVGESFGQNEARTALGRDDVRDFAALAQQLLHPLPPLPGQPAQSLLLATQAFYDAASNRCPSLQDDNRCAIHEDRKPGACEVVPYDALMPDRLQHAVLAGRRHASWYEGVDCIRPGTSPGHVATEARRVVQEDARKALDARRHALAQDKTFWGDAVFQSLTRELLGDPAAVLRIPTQGFVAIPVAPILMLLASLSEPLKQRCLRFIEAQMPLVDAALRVRSKTLPFFSLTQAAAPSAAARELTATVRALGAVHVALRGAPTQAAHPRAAATEAWLGL